MNYNFAAGLLNILAGEIVIKAEAWTLINDIVDGLKAFNYESVKFHLKENWNYGNAWEDLIRSEINAGRPVLYYGDGCTSTFAGATLPCSEMHYFVIDGYHAADPSLFHVNFGWTGSGNGFYRLDSL